MKINHKMFKVIFYTILTSILITGGQVFWKIGISRAGGFYLTDQTWIANIFRIILNSYVLLGFFIYAIATVFFMYLLANYKVSFIIPLSSISYIFALIAGRLIFDEFISISNIVGVFIIIIGVAVISMRH